MTERLLLIVAFVLVVGGIWWAAMCMTPGKGVHLMLERIVQGMVVCFACYLLLLPFGIKLPQTPAMALFSGYWGLPGLALCTFLCMLP